MHVLSPGSTGTQTPHTAQLSGEDASAAWMPCSVCGTEQAVSERESAITGRILQVKDKFLSGLKQELPGSSKVTERAQNRRRQDLRGPAFFRGSHFYYKQGGHMAKAPSTEYPA